MGSLVSLVRSDNSIIATNGNCMLRSMEDTLGKMGWPKQQVSVFWDKEDFDSHNTHNLVAQLHDNLVKVETIGFGFVDNKAFEVYLDMVDIVALWDFHHPNIRLVRLCLHHAIYKF